MSIYLMEYTTDEKEGITEFVLIDINHVVRCQLFTVIKETTKMYHVSNRTGVEYRFRKSDIGIVKYSRFWVPSGDEEKAIKQYHSLQVEVLEDKMKNVQEKLDFHKSQLEGYANERF